MLKRTQNKRLLGLTMGFLIVAGALTLSTYSTSATSGSVITTITAQDGMSAFVKQYSPVRPTTCLQFHDSTD